MNKNEKRIDIEAFEEDIIVQLIRIAQRMEFIETLYFEFGAEPQQGPAVEESVRAAAKNSLADVRVVFKALDEHTNIRSYMGSEELEWAFPKEAQDGSQNPREDTRRMVGVHTPPREAMV